MPSPFSSYRGTAAPAITAQQWGNSRGGEYLAHGISQAGEALAKGIERMSEQAKQTKAMRALVKSYAKETGNEALAHEADIKSGPELLGMMESWGYVQTTKRFQAEQEKAEQDKRARAAFENAIGMAHNMANRDAGLQAGRNILQGFSGGGLRGGMQALQAAGDPALQNKVAGPDEYLRAAAMARSPEMLDRAIAMQRADPQATLPPYNFITDPETGNRFLQSGNTTLPSWNANVLSALSGANTEGFVALPNTPGMTWRNKPEGPTMDLNDLKPLDSIVEQLAPMRDILARPDAELERYAKTLGPAASQKQNAQAKATQLEKQLRARIALVAKARKLSQEEEANLYEMYGLTPQTKVGRFTVE